MIFYPYFAAFVTSMSMTFVRVIYGFYFRKPSEGYSSNFEGVMPKLYFVFLAIVAVASYLIMNKALQHFDSVYMVPLFKVWTMLHNIASGGIFLGEFADYDNWYEFFLFLLGIVICMAGILLLTIDPNKNKGDKK